MHENSDPLKKLFQLVKDSELSSNINKEVIIQQIVEISKPTFLSKAYAKNESFKLIAITLEKCHGILAFSHTTKDLLPSLIHAWLTELRDSNSKVISDVFEVLLSSSGMQTADLIFNFIASLLESCLSYFSLTNSNFKRN